MSAGKAVSTIDKVVELADALPSVGKIVVIPSSGDAFDAAAWPDERFVGWDAFLEAGAGDADAAFAPVPFAHPQFVARPRGRENGTQTGPTRTFRGGGVAATPRLPRGSSEGARIAVASPSEPAAAIRAGVRSRRPGLQEDATSTPTPQESAERTPAHREHRPKRSRREGLLPLRGGAARIGSLPRRRRDVAGSPFRGRGARIVAPFRGRAARIVPPFRGGAARIVLPSAAAPRGSFPPSAAAAPRRRRLAQVLYSSGTTGMPKSIAHGCGNTLLQHAKELCLHSDLREGDKMLFYTTCGWMMWNWMVSSLFAGAAVVCFDGFAAYPKLDAPWTLVQDEKVTHLGTSPRYFQA